MSTAKERELVSTAKEREVLNVIKENRKERELVGTAKERELVSTHQKKGARGYSNREREGIQMYRKREGARKDSQLE